MTPQKPMVSIVCTNFNKGAWIRDAIESFLSQQTEFAIEIILIDDASTDQSKKIIAKYAKKYPDLITAIYNEQNQGITKTWIKACKHAKGKYIARCDGDDYWTDPLKLQKQVDALEKSKDSKWSSTDFDIVQPDGKLTDRSAFENKIIKRPKIYEEMLATKGFTMASTWLVETVLMRAINKTIDLHTADDTFNIQLELFHRTKPTYLPYATAAYRTGYTSDSKPESEKASKLRNSKLLKTQLEYLNKYKNADYKKISEFVLRANYELETGLSGAKHNFQNAKKIIDDQNHIINDQQNNINSIINSKRYKLAAVITKPGSIIKLIKHKINH